MTVGERRTEQNIVAGCGAGDHKRVGHAAIIIRPPGRAEPAAVNQPSTFSV